MKWICALALLIYPAAAGAAPPDALLQSRIIQGGTLPDGRWLAAIELTLAPGWKTYWRSPGEGGLPPEFDWSASQNLGGVEPLWPNPQAFDIGGMVNIGYHDSLVLPLAITPANAAQPVMLGLTMALGVCKDICIPANVTFQTDVNGDTPLPPAIALALERRPLPPSAVSAQTWTCTDSAIKDGQSVRLTLDMPKWAGAADEIVVIEHSDAKIWASPAVVSRAGDNLTAEFDLVPPSAKPFDLDGADLTITLLAGGTVAEFQGCPQE